jgi:uncharacterized protein
VTAQPRQLMTWTHWWPLAVACVTGLAAGAVNAVAGGGSVVSFPALLLHTPPEVFRTGAPYLVLGSSVLLAVLEPLARRLGVGRRGSRNRARPSVRWLATAVAVQLVISVYGGYFGAGMGILMLAFYAPRRGRAGLRRGLPVAPPHLDAV